VAKAKKAAAAAAADPSGLIDPDSIEAPDAAASLLELLGDYGPKAKVAAEQVWRLTLADLAAAARQTVETIALTPDQLDVLRSAAYLKTLAVFVAVAPDQEDVDTAKKATADAKSIMADVVACELLAKVDVQTIIYRSLQVVLGRAIDAALGLLTRAAVVAVVA